MCVTKGMTEVTATPKKKHTKCFNTTETKPEEPCRIGLVSFQQTTAKQWHCHVLAKKKRKKNTQLEFRQAKTPNLKSAKRASTRAFRCFFLVSFPLL